MRTRADIPRAVVLLLLVLGCGSDEESQATDSGSTTPLPSGPVFGSWLPDGYAPSAPQQLILFGDSVTRGAGATAPSLGYQNLLQTNDDVVWPDFSEQDLQSRFGDVPLFDVSAGGATTEHVVDIQLPNLSGQLPATVNGETLVVGTIGGNDMVLTVFAAEVAEDPETVAATEIEKMIDNMREIATFFGDKDRFPDPVYLYITNVYEPTDAVGQADGCFGSVNLPTGIQTIDTGNLEMLLVAQEYGYGYVDMRGHFLGHGHNADDAELEWHHPEDPTTWFVDDCIHPTDRGHHEIRRLFMAAIDGAPLSE